MFRRTSSFITATRRLKKRIPAEKCNLHLSLRFIPKSLEMTSLRLEIAALLLVRSRALKPTLPQLVRHSSSSRSGSSSIYLARQRADPYVKGRSTGEGLESNDSSFVSRSAFKLIELNQKCGLIRPGMRIVDLGAAPGGWTQAALGELEKGKGKGGVVIAVDLLKLHSSVSEHPSVVSIQGNFLDTLVQARILRSLEPFSPGMSGPKVDLVLSDMLANQTGNPLRDAQGSLDLCTAALSFALANLSIQKDSISTKMAIPNGARGRTRAEKKGPVLVMKSLTSDLSKEFEMELKRHFASVKREKPNSSRPESREFYWVCGGLKDRSQVVEVDEEQENDELAIYF